MSSAPYQLGLQVLTRLQKEMPKDFIIEAKTEADCYRLIRTYARSLPASMELLCYNIGLRPDKDVPVARFFVEVHERKREPRMLYWAWSAVIAGGRQLA